MKGLIFLMLFFSINVESTAFGYVLVVGLTTLIFLRLVVNARIYDMNKSFFLTFLCISCVHVSYIGLGIFKGANELDAIRNFSGFLTILPFIAAVSILRVDSEVLLIQTKRALILSVPLLIYSYYISPSFYVADTAASFGQFRSIFSFGGFLYIGLCLVHCSRGRLECGGRSPNYRLGFKTFVVFLVMAIVSTFSKVILIFTLVVIWFAAPKRIIVATAFSIFLLPLLMTTENLGQLAIFLEDYGSGSAGNLVRINQLGLMLNDLSIFGSGLGVEVPGYDHRTQSYGFELTYINMLHKFGIFSIVYYVFFLIQIPFILNRLLRKTLKDHDLCYITIFPVIVASVANPMLSHPLVIFYVSVWWVFEYRSHSVALNTSQLGGNTIA